MIKELGTLKQANITILVEDTISFDTPFWGRFGLSMLLELYDGTTQKNILFDTNSAAAPVLHNLNLLGKSLGDIHAIFLSHCHYDHTDGLPGILEALGHPIPVFAHPDLFRPCFEINPDGVRHIGLTNQSRQALGSSGAILTQTKDPLNLMTGVITTGEIQRVTSFEPLEDLYTLEDGRVVQDHERDDTALILNLPQGLVIVTGCCHAGIVNTMQHARKITGVEKIYAVVGGLHFISASAEKVERSIEALGEVDWIFAGHCTGFEGLHKMANVFGDRLSVIHSGSMIHFPVDNVVNRIDTISTAQRDQFRFNQVSKPA